MATNPNFLQRLTAVARAVTDDPGDAERRAKQQADLAATQANTAHTNAQIPLVNAQTAQLAAETAARERARKDEEIVMGAWAESGGDPNKAMMLAGQRNASPRAMFGFQSDLAKYAKETAAATHEKNIVKADDHAALVALLDSVTGAPPEQRLDAYRLAQQAAEKQGLADPGEFPAEYPGDAWVAAHRNVALAKGDLAARTAAEQEAKDKAAKAKTDAEKAAFDIIAARNQSITGAPNAQGLTPAQAQAAKQAEMTAAASASDRKADNDRQAAVAAETRRHNLRTEAQAAAKTGDGKPLPAPAIKTLETAKGNSDQLTRLEGDFKDAYAGNTITGGAENFLGGLGFEKDKGQTQWWQDYQAHKNEVRHGLFGGALTPGEAAEYDKQDITPRMDPGQIRKNLARQKEIVDTALSRLGRVYEKGGYNRGQIDEYGVSQQKPTASYKVGESVMYNGKPHKIQAIKPDGKLVLEQ